MRTAPRRFLRCLTPPVVAALVAITGLGLTASPAAADANLQVALSISTPIVGAAASTVYVGQPVTYQLTVFAGSSGLSGGATFNDGLPADVTFKTYSGAGWTCGYLAPAISCVLSSPVAANVSSTVTLNMAVSATATASSFTFNPNGSGMSGSTAATGSATVTVPVMAAADLALVKTMNPPPGAGQVSYNLAVTNNGPSATAGTINIADNLPAGFGYGSAGGTGWTCTPGAAPTGPNALGQSIGCTTTSALAPAATSTVTVVANGGGRITTPASVSSATFDPNGANNTAVAPQGLVPYGTAADPGPCGPPSSGTPAVRTCKLVAVPGTVSVPNFATPIPIWGFAVDTGQTATGGTIPGPTLVATAGETLNLIVRNALPAHAGDTNKLAVAIPGITTSHPDSVGVDTGSITSASSPSYNWANLAAGTYVYEAAPTANGARQLAMGLSGLLIVRPAGFAPGTPTEALYPPALQPPGAPVVLPVPLPCIPPIVGCPPPPPPPTTTTTTAAPTTTSTSTSTTTSTTSTTVAPTSTTSSTSSTTSSTTSTTSTTVAPTTTTSTTSTTVASTTTTTVPPPPPPPPPVPAAIPPPTACNTATSSGFTAETLVQVNELSSEFHNNPFTSTMVPGGGNAPISNVTTNASAGSPDVARYVPDVFLLNGHAYPDSTGVTLTTPTDCLAVHYANLGMLEKSVGVLGRRQTVMADDSVRLAHPQNLATKYLNAAESVDAVVDMNGATPGTLLPVLDFGRHLHNGDGAPANATPATNTGMALGGQLALIQVGGSPPPTTLPSVDLVGLDRTTVAVNSGGIATPPALGLTVRPTAAITGGEYTIDNIVPAGTAPPAQSISVGGTASVPSSLFSGLPNGDHTIWARVKNGALWSDPPSGVVFTYDRVGTTPNQQGGPVIEHLSLDPNITSGNNANKTPGSPLLATGPQCDGTTGVLNTPAVSCDLMIDGTATSPLPDWQISSFTWTVSGTGLSGTVTGLSGSPAELSASIPAAQLKALGLSPGTHSVSIVVTEAQGASTRASNPATVDFTWVTSGPTATIGTFDPAAASPASDYLGNANYYPSVRIRGTISDPGALAQITDGEMWFLPVVNGVSPVGEISAGVPTANGTGVKVTPTTGVWTAPASATVPYDVQIPSSEFTALPQGPVRIYVHGKDIAGNWGPWVTKDLVLDKLPPVVTGTPVVTKPSTGHYTLTLSGQDPGTPLTACTVTAGRMTPKGCGIAERTGIKGVEWQISYTGVIDNPGLNDFTYFVPGAPNSVTNLAIDLSGGPQPYPAGSTVVFRLLDGAGNWSNWTTVSIP